MNPPTLTETGTSTSILRQTRLRSEIPPPLQRLNHNLTKKSDTPPTVTFFPPSLPSTSNSATLNPRWTTSWQSQPVHAPLTANDLNFHGSFSGHSPLLLLSQPSSSIFESRLDPQPPNLPDFGASRRRSLSNQLGGINLEDPPEATDAVALRLLNRALVVNRPGGVSWEVREGKGESC